VVARTYGNWGTNSLIIAEAEIVALGQHHELTWLKVRVNLLVSTQAEDIMSPVSRCARDLLLLKEVSIRRVSEIVAHHSRVWRWRGSGRSNCDGHQWWCPRRSCGKDAAHDGAAPQASATLISMSVTALRLMPFAGRQNWPG